MEPPPEETPKETEKCSEFYDRLVPELPGMGYEERMKEVKLTTLQRSQGYDRNIKYFGRLTVEIDEMFTLNTKRKRGHGWKLETQMNHRDVRKFTFSVRILEKWNELMNRVWNQTLFLILKLDMIGT
ncbi:uncharacterized protein [Procambarus clarkii]|uniref:uncharacterized protein n=1 Tax=Procambarus clarkii TaxID=6728 RepID=UPI003742C30A